MHFIGKKNTLIKVNTIRISEQIGISVYLAAEQSNKLNVNKVARSIVSEKSKRKRSCVSSTSFATKAAVFAKNLEVEKAAPSTKDDGRRKFTE